MVSLASRKRVVKSLMERGCSRSRSCKTAYISRGTSLDAPKDRNPELRIKVLELAKANPRYGFRRVHALLPHVNIKAVHRIWKEESLRLSRRVRRKLQVPKLPSLSYTAPNQGWCMDFASERLENGRQARILAVLDCFTRECLLLKAAPSFPAISVQEELEWLFLTRAKPSQIVSDNGPEFRAIKLPPEVESAFIQPGKPWQNGRVESFFDKLRDELLRGSRYSSGQELQSELDDFQDHYNTRRPHRSLQGLAPANFVQQLTTTGGQYGH